MAADAAQPPDNQPKAKIFISYSRKDMPFADRLEAALRAYGFEVLIDRQEIYAFEDWWIRIKALIGQADTVVFVLSPDSAASEVALKEVAQAASLNKRLAPIVWRYVPDSVVPEALRRLNFIFFDDEAQFDERMRRLAEALENDIEWVRRHTEYGEQARRWVAAGRPGPRGLLLQPPVLDEAEAWLTLRPRTAPEPTEETIAFVAESRKAEITASRRRRTVRGVVSFLLVGIILGLGAWINQEYIRKQWQWWTVIRPYAAAQVWPFVLPAAKERALKPGDSFKECAKDCDEMVVVPAGSFSMGSQPRYQVTVAKPFAVSKSELTFADWDACVAGGGCGGYRPIDEGWGRGNRPVIYVSWEDAKRYIEWLSAVTGKRYRLLSNAEYEYSKRGGTETTFPWGNSYKLDEATAMANCTGCGDAWSDIQTAPVDSFPPNGFGLFDMVGNVWEWVEDCPHVDDKGAPTDGSAWVEGGDCARRIVRGGSWRDLPGYLGGSERATPITRNNALGFRVARTLDER